jgi:hypothetical protein
VRPRVSSVTFALVLTTVGVARAQVNTENLRKRVKAIGYTFILEGSITADTGNTEGITAGGGIGGGYASGRHLVFAYARADYAEYSGVTSIDKTFAHARYNYEFEDWLWGELYVQAQSDAFQRLELRNLMGIGPRFRIMHISTGTSAPHDAQTPPERDDLDVYLGTSYMFERDAISVAPGAPDASVQVWHRWSTYVSAQWQMDTRVILATTLYVQPAIPDYGNVRVLSESVATFKVTKLLSASVSGSVRYDSAPPTEVKTTDAEIKNTLALTF